MSQQELLKRVVCALNDLGIEYMLTGSLVSSLQGEPRSTHDIDIIITIRPSMAQDLVRSFPPPEYYVSQESILGALETQSAFNLIEVNTGDKVDFWILTKAPFDVSRFARKYIEEVLGMRIAVSRPEDTILAKLSWAKKSGGSEKHFTDALRVYEVQYEKLDISYVQGWADRLGVASMLQKIREEAEPL